MKLSIDSPTPSIQTKDILGNPFDLENFKGQKNMVLIFRFSTCPFSKSPLRFCNLRIYTLSKEYEKLRIKIVAIFESSNENLNKHLSHYKPPFSIISDSEGQYYKSYGLSKSLFGVFKEILRECQRIF
ncbi:redoxin domain-containing protein [Sulfurimonas sp. MAG313]|nr:redoxin domain-containing protein [Sulfurimonas sp. MAG313]MDF1881829.1 redoxin domain-containing protein [Sulfurimonas sp. MAG313]